MTDDMANKEFKVQKALGLAGEYFLTITATSTEPQAYIQKIKEVVEKHTFTSKCIATEVKYFYTKHTTTGGGIGHTATGLTGIVITFCVKCLHEIKDLIITEFPHTSHKIDIELRIWPGLFDIDSITIQQNFTIGS